jgi:predicted ATPase
MKLTRVLLRWYKSFHLNYRGSMDRGETTGYRPWNTMLAPPSAPGEEFPFIEIPVEPDITTIVGANESGKSHLLNAISKVITGFDISRGKAFARTDLCHYAGIRTRNVDAWPNIGLQFQLENETEAQSIASLLGNDAPSEGVADHATVTIILAPSENKPAWGYLFIEPTEQPWELKEGQIDTLRKTLPLIQFIDSKALLTSEITLHDLIAAYEGKASAVFTLRDRRAVERVAQEIEAFVLPPAPQQVTAELINTLDRLKGSLRAKDRIGSDDHDLARQLFHDIMDINLESVKFIHNLTVTDRGYIEGQISKWNETLDDRLNISHYWKQDEQFSLTVNYKDGIAYFEIRDRTGSIYTFEERSSGLKFFLSYYIQAKAMEATSRNRNSIILMDEPDAALSIVGQRNLLAVFESLVSTDASTGACQLIYTTHSPYLINRNFPRRIRLVKKEDSEQGTQYIEQTRVRRYEPVRTALGIDSAPSLLLGFDNVLFEGATDQFLIAELVRLFATPATVGELIDLNTVMLVSADGAPNVASVLEQSTWADEPIPPTLVLLDSDEAGRKAFETITGSRGRKPLIEREFVVMIGDVFIGCRDMEDIIPHDLYAEGVKEYIMRWLPATYSASREVVDTALVSVDFGRNGIVLAVADLFETVGSDYDKLGIMREVIALTSSRITEGGDDPALQTLRGNLIRLCDIIREKLDGARAARATVSTTQSVKRLVHDFQRLHRNAANVTNMQSLLSRIESEIVPIGPDGEKLAQIVRRYLEELKQLRAAGQTRLEGSGWERWRQRLDRMRGNPLALAEEEPSVGGGQGDTDSERDGVSSLPDQRLNVPPAGEASEMPPRNSLLTS